MSHYIKTGEFAKLRNTSKRALRYYEQLGLLTPVSLNDSNNYHYYHENQLVTLDVIQICTKIGLNLKKLPQYIKEDGNLDYQGILELCLTQTSSQIRHFQNMERILQEIFLCKASCNKHQGETDCYIRHIPERQIICRKLKKFGTYYENQRELSILYRECDEKEVPYSYTFGILQEIENGKITYYIFTQILDEPVDKQNVFRLPEGDYMCHQDSERHADIPISFIPTMHGRSKSIIISTFMLFDELNIDHPTWEKQILT